MRVARLFLPISILFLLLFSAQPAHPGGQSASPTASQLLQRSLAALQGNTPITDVTLAGTARRIAGSDDESGTATYRAITGANRLDLGLSGGSRTEIVNLTTAPSAGSWSGPDGVSHAMAPHNLMGQATMSPAFTIAALTSAPNFVLTLVGQETKNGHSVNHISASQQLPPTSSKTAQLTQHLTQMEIFLDTTTALPVAFDLSTHPDSDAGLDIPVELLFSDYRSVNSTQIPFRIQRFLNNSLLLDLQITSAQINSGLSASLFTAQ